MVNMKIMIIILLGLGFICYLEERQIYDGKGIDFFWKSRIVYVVYKVEFLDVKMMGNFIVVFGIQRGGIFYSFYVIMRLRNFLR